MSCWWSIPHIYERLLSIKRDGSGSCICHISRTLTLQYFQWCQSIIARHSCRCIQTCRCPMRKSGKQHGKYRSIFFYESKFWLASNMIFLFVYVSNTLERCRRNLTTKPENHHNSRTFSLFASHVITGLKPVFQVTVQDTYKRQCFSFVSNSELVCTVVLYSM